jgi:hypothetical protein
MIGAGFRNCVAMDNLQIASSLKLLAMTKKHEDNVIASSQRERGNLGF